MFLFLIERDFITKRNLYIAFIGVLRNQRNQGVGKLGKQFYAITELRSFTHAMLKPLILRIGNTVFGHINNTSIAPLFHDGAIADKHDNKD